MTASATAMMMCVVNRPNHRTNRGVKNADSAVPTMPAPNTPVAKPRRAGSYQLFDERDADREDRSRDAEEEPEHHQQRIRPDRAGDTDRQHRHDRRQGDGDEHGAATEAVGQRAD